MDRMYRGLRYLWVVNLLLLAGISYVSARTVNDYVAGQAPGGQPQPVAWLDQDMPPIVPTPASEKILDRDLFQTRPEPDSAETDPNPTPDKPRETQLRLQLLGTVVHRFDLFPGRATIKDLDRDDVGVYQVGDEIRPGVKVTQINVNYVLLNVSGTEYKLPLQNETAALHRCDHFAKEDDFRPLAHPHGISQVGEYEYVIKRNFLEDALRDPNQLVISARAIPNFIGSGAERRVDGFRIYRIQPDSVYDLLGLRNGDVLKSINGEALDSMEKGLSLFQTMRAESRIEIGLLRSGTGIAMTYEVE